MVKCWQVSRIELSLIDNVRLLNAGFYHLPVFSNDTLVHDIMKVPVKG